MASHFGMLWICDFYAVLVYVVLLPLKRNLAFAEIWTRVFWFVPFCANLYTVKVRFYPLPLVYIVGIYKMGCIGLLVGIVLHLRLVSNLESAWIVVSTLSPGWKCQLPAERILYMAAWTVKRPTPPAAASLFRRKLHDFTIHGKHLCLHSQCFSNFSHWFLTV